MRGTIVCPHCGGVVGGLSSDGERLLKYLATADGADLTKDEDMRAFTARGIGRALDISQTNIYRLADSLHQRGLILQGRPIVRRGAPSATYKLSRSGWRVVKGLEAAEGALAAIMGAHEGATT